MADSKSEQVLKALAKAIKASLTTSSKFERNGTLPSRIPAGGFVTLHDGDPGIPEVTLSPTEYIYEHRAEVDIVVQGAKNTTRDAAFDKLKQSIGSALDADRTLGGLCDYVIGEAPAPLDLPIEGAQDLKAATIGVILTYGTPDPLT